MAASPPMAVVAAAASRRPVAAVRAVVAVGTQAPLPVVVYCRSHRGKASSAATASAARPVGAGEARPVQVSTPPHRLAGPAAWVSPPTSPAPASSTAAAVAAATGTGPAIWAGLEPAMVAATAGQAPRPLRIAAAVAVRRAIAVPTVAAVAVPVGMAGRASSSYRSARQRVSPSTRVAAAPCSTET